MENTTTATLTVEEIHEAVRFWLIKQVNGVEVDGEIDFHVEGREDPNDWHARYPLTYELAGASFVVHFRSDVPSR